MKMYICSMTDMSEIMTILSDATDVAPADPCVAPRLRLVHATRNFPLNPSMVIG